jgi:hypothetical protein
MVYPFFHVFRSALTDGIQRVKRVNLAHRSCVVRALRIVTGVPDALPIIGPLLVTLLRGGTSVGQGTLSRFYTVHTLVLPLLGPLNASELPSLASWLLVTIHSTILGFLVSSSP